MTLTVKTAKFTAPSDNTIWSSVFSENGLFVFLEVTGDDEGPAPINGNTIMDKILTDYTNFPERNFAVVKNILEDLKPEKNIKSVAIGIKVGNKLYIGGRGGEVVFMQRKGEIGKILSSDGIVEGNLETGDILLLSSDKLDKIIDIQKRNSLLLGENPEDLVENIAPLIVDNQEARGSAFLIMKLVSSDENKIISQKTYGIFDKKKEKIKALWQRALTLTENGKGEEYEDEEEKRSKKTLLTIAVILILLLTISIFFNINHTGSSEKHKKMAEILNLVSHQYDEAVSLLELNPARSRELLTAGKLALTPILNEFPKKSKEYKEISDWLSKISSKEVVAYKIYKLTGVPLFYDFNLVKKGADVKSLASYKETKVFLDTVNGVVYKLNTTTKQAEIVVGRDVVKDAKDVDIHGKNIYILNSDGVVEINTTSKTSRIIIKTDEKWGEVISLASYGGNLYLLDRGKNAIWKYIFTDYGFSGRQSYLNSDTMTDLSKSVKILIDGSVWVLSSDGLTKFTKGLIEPFSFKGLSDNMQNAVAMSIVEGENYLYILDKTLSRIIVFDKDGNYYAQYQWDELGSATDILSSEEEKKIFVTMASKLYAIDIK